MSELFIQSGGSGCHYSGQDGRKNYFVIDFSELQFTVAMLADWTIARTGKIGGIMHRFVLFFAACLSACGEQNPLEGEAERQQAPGGASANAPKFWDGQPIDLAGSDECLQRYPYVADSAMRQMLSGPNWDQLGPRPDLDKVKAANGVQYGIMRRGNQCEVAFTVDTTIDGTSYKWRGVCPFDASPGQPDLLLTLRLPECEWF